MYKSANTQRFDTALCASRVTKLRIHRASPARGTDKSDSIQHAPYTLYVRWTCVRNTLDGRYMRAQCRHFIVFFSVTHSRRTTHALKIDYAFARASFVRWSCVSTRYWFVEGASLTRRIFLYVVFSYISVVYMYIFLQILWNKLLSINYCLLSIAEGSWVCLKYWTHRNA